MSYHWYDFVGNLGVFCIVFSYLMIQMEKWDSTQLKYSLINGIGSILIVVSLCFEWNWSAFWIEFFWLLISLYGLWLYWKRSKNKLEPEG
jgi:hypothetical protein